MLVLDLLGALSLRGDTGAVPPAAQQKRRLGLLAILALGGRQGLSRHRIEAYLWPESTSARARHALDQAVYGIRHTLGSDVILSTGQDLKLNPEYVNADIWELDDAIRARQWASVVDIYKGTLLAGFHFGESRELEAWIDAERARLLVQYQTALESLADRSAEAGDRSQDVTWRRRLASSDPLSAGRTKQLMLALAKAGDRAGAVKQARQYQELVRQELEMEPDSEIERLAITLSQSPPVEGQSPLARSQSPPAENIHQRSPRAPAAVSSPTVHSIRTPFRLDLSRTAAVAFFALIPTLLIGAFAVKNGQVRGLPSSVAASAARPLSRVPLPAARDAYLRGISAWEDRTREGLDNAIVQFRRATDLDPGYAAAHAELAEAYVRIGYFGYRPAEAMFPKAKAAALRSIELDSTLSTAHTALASARAWEHDFAGAEREYRKAISLDPSNALAHQWYGVLLMILRRVPEAVAEEKLASELEPLSLQIQNNYGAFLNVAGEHAAALRHFEKTVGEEPDSAWVRRNPWVLANLSRVYADNGDYPSAIRAIERAVEIIPGSPRALHTMAVIYHGMGRTDLARRAFARADTAHEQYAAYRGMFYADQGNPDSAFLWFDRQEQWGIQPMLSLQSDRHIQPLRRDPRYRALLRRIGIPARGSENGN